MGVPTNARLHVGCKGGCREGAAPLTAWSSFEICSDRLSQAKLHGRAALPYIRPLGVALRLDEGMKNHKRQTASEMEAVQGNEGLPPPGGGPNFCPWAKSCTPKVCRRMFALPPLPAARADGRSAPRTAKPRRLSPAAAVGQQGARVMRGRWQGEGHHTHHRHRAR